MKVNTQINYPWCARLGEAAPSPIQALAFCVVALLVGSISLTLAAQSPQILLEESRGIEGFELYDNGLYYWITTSETCAGGSPPDDLIYWKSYRFDPGSPNAIRLGACDSIELRTNVVRDGAYFYRANAPNRIFRSSANSTFGFNNILDFSSIANAQLQALDYYDEFGFVYFGLRSTDGSGDFGIYGVSKNASNADITVSDAIGLGSATPATENYIHKMEVIRYGPSNTPGVVYLIGPQASTFGDIPPSRLFLKTFGGSFFTPGTLLETDVTDFNIARTGPFPDDVSIYATKFVGLVRGGEDLAKTGDATESRGTSDVGGYVLEIIPETGAVNEKYYNVGATVYSLTTDDLYYYFIQNISGTFRIQRQLKTATGAGSNIVSGSRLFFNLRSDDEWLYYIEPRSTTGHVIQRLRRNAAPITLDVVARSVEAIHVTQALPEGSVFEIDLIEGKDAVVRGYGDLDSNTTNQPNWMVDARLDLFDDGVLIADFRPRHLANLSAFSGPENTRLDFDLRNPTNFFFDVPGRYIREGMMEFRLTLNESNLAPETETTTNNTTSAIYTVRKSGIQVLAEPADPETPSIIFRPMNVNGQPIIRLRNVANLATLIERAKAYMPFGEVTVHEVNSVLRKEILGIDFGGFGMPGEKDWALLNLSVSTLTSNYLYGNVQVAMVPKGTPDFNGVAFPITATLVRMETDISDTSGFVDFNRPRGALSLAHEWGHIAGILHINNVGCGNQPAGPYEASNPWNSCNIGSPGIFSNWVGFDPLTRQVFAPDDVGDLMTYRFPRWISGPYFADDRWRRPTSINTGIRAGRGETRGAAPDQLVVGALLDSDDGSYRFTHFFRWPAGLAAIPEFPDPNDAGFDTQTLTLRDKDGGELFSRGVIPFPNGEGEPNIGVIYAWLPWDESINRLEISVSDTVLATIMRSGNTPDVMVDAPIVDSAAGFLRLKWNAFDADGDLVLAHVLYSNDAGASWENHVMQTPLHGADLPLESLPGGEDCRVKIIFSDGMNTVTEELGPFRIATHPPEILLDGPAEGATVPHGETINFYALALDTDQGSLPSADLAWTITGRDVQNFEGARVQLDDLAPGDYTLEVSGTDDDGMTGTATRNFSVGPMLIAEASSAPIIDGVCDEVYSEGTALKIPYDDGTYFEARFVHFDDRLYVCMSGLQFVGGSSNNRLVGIFLDLDNSGDTTPTGSDIGYFVSEFGEREIFVPESDTYNTSDDAPEGFMATVSRTPNGYNAEFCLNDSNIGDWNDLVGVQITHVLTTFEFWPPGSSFVDTSTYGLAWFGDTASAPEAPLLPPVANAGEDRRLTVLEETDVYLNGVNSLDPNGDALTFSWAQTGGPNVDLMETDKDTPFFKTDPGTDEETYTFELTVTNAQGNDTDSVSITLAPHPAPYIFSLDVILNYLLNIERRPADANQDDKVDAADVVHFVNESE